jgi:hypothetical protein
MSHFKVKHKLDWSDNMLPVYKFENKMWFRDERLGEYRNVDDPNDTRRIDDIPNSKLQRPTKQDRIKMWGE